MCEVLRTKAGPVLKVTEGYIVMYRMESIELYDSLDFRVKPRDVCEVDISKKIVEFKDEAIQNKIALVRHLFKQVTADEIDKSILELITQVLFDDKCVCTLDELDGPKVIYPGYIVQINVDGKLEIASSNGRVLMESASSIYEKVLGSSVPRVVLFQTVAPLIIGLQDFKLLFYLLRTDVLDQFSDYIKQVTEQAQGNAIYEDAFNSICPNVEETHISYSKEGIRINQGGKIFVIDGGDGVALEINGNTVRVSRKGMRKDILSANSIEDASSKIAARVSEVLKPCGERAKTVYIERIKPTMKGFVDETVKYVKESAEDDDENTEKSRKKVRPQSRPMRNQGMGNSNLHSAMLAVVMFILIILLLFIGGC